jgi:hypothetical protein
MICSLTTQANLVGAAAVTHVCCGSAFLAECRHLAMVLLAVPSSCFSKINLLRLNRRTAEIGIVLVVKGSRVLTYATSGHIAVPQDTEGCSCRCVGRCNPAGIEGRSGRRGHTGVLDLEAWLVSSILLVRSRGGQHIRQHRRAEQSYNHGNCACCQGDMREHRPTPQYVTSREVS